MAESPSAGEARAADESGPTVRPDSRARKVGRDLAWMAPLVLLAFFAVGVVSVLDLILSLATDDSLSAAQRLPMKVSAVFNLLYYGLIGGLLSQLFRASGAILDVLTTRSEAAETAEQRLLQELRRVADALERPTPLPASPVVAPPGDPVNVVRKAIEDARWVEAESLLRRLLEDHPDAPEAARLARELDEARATAAQSLRARIDAAREVNDPHRVLELRDGLTLLLEGESLRSFDQEMIRWLMGIVQKRLRVGAMRAEMRVDAADLAAKVAERFDHTPEGASLRAALPTLRRSAGLCARCGQPYTGIADACPACLSTTSFPAFGSTEPPDADGADVEDD